MPAPQREPIVTRFLGAAVNREAMRLMVKRALEIHSDDDKVRRQMDTLQQKLRVQNENYRPMSITGRDELLEEAWWPMGPMPLGQAIRPEMTVKEAFMTTLAQLATRMGPLRRAPVKTPGRWTFAIGHLVLDDIDLAGCGFQSYDAVKERRAEMRRDGWLFPRTLDEFPDLDDATRIALR